MQMGKKQLILINLIIITFFISACLILTMIGKPKIYSGYLTLVKSKQQLEKESNVIDNNETNEVNQELQTAFFINEKNDNAFENIQAIKYFINNNWIYARGDYKIVDNFIVLDNIKINTFFVPAYLIERDESLFSYIINNIF